MFQKPFTLILAVCICNLGIAFSQTVTPAPPCSDEIRNETCSLPSCRCSGTEIPGNIDRVKVPQMVFLTFDDAVNVANFPFYEEVINPRKNPNGQPITASFFISHEYTNYTMVHQLWRRGHDISLHSITHTSPSDYWTNLDEEGWRKELVEQRDQMAYFARIPPSEVQGMRAPFLQTGADRMYKALTDGGFAWECSRPTLTYRKPGLWPYTNDYASSQDCQIQPCPIGAYPGFWTVPMVNMLGGNDFGCAMIDACLPVPETQKETYDLLVKNFEEHYNGNRAPFGIYTHAAWLNGTGGEEDYIWQRRLGYIQFLDYLGGLNDVYIVGISRALEWIKDPTELANIENFPPFQVPEKPDQCPINKACRYPGPPERWLHSCQDCPNSYPWLGNPLGRA